MPILLSKRQREVLELMAQGEELVQDRSGKGWPQFWIGLQRTNGRMWRYLVEAVLISTRDDFNAKTVYWHINDSGLRLLAGETKIYRVYRGSKAVYVENWRDQC